MNRRYPLTITALGFADLDMRVTHAVSKAQAVRPDRARAQLDLGLKAIAPPLMRDLEPGNWAPSRTDTADTWARHGAIDGVLCAWESRELAAPPDVGQTHDKSRCWSAAQAHAFMTARCIRAGAPPN